MNLSFKWVRNMAVLALGIVLLVSCGKGGTEEPPQPTDDAPPTEAPSEAFELLPGTVIINEVMPVSDGEGSAWAEFTNIDSVPVPISGAVLTDEDGNSYTFPAEAPMIPPGTFFVVFFDGEDNFDADAEPFSFHSNSEMVDPFDLVGDQLALYSSADREPVSLVDFVAWGSPAEGEDAAAVEAGLWLEGAFTNSERGGVITGSSQVGESIGLFPGRPSRILDSWVVYSAAETTAGEENGVPTTEVMLPNTGALLLNQDFRLAWYNVPFAQQYQLQIDDDAQFGSPDVDLVLDEPYYTSAPVDGTYFWRTKAILEGGLESPFSPTAEFTVVTLEPLELPEEPIEGAGVFVEPVAQGQGGNTGIAWNITYSPSTAPADQANFWEVDYLNTLPPILQRKDSNLLCWDGDKELGAREPWDGPHADTPGNHSRHGRNYCARASIAMINHYYGGDLTQDRITYHHFGRDNWPLGDLGHDKPLAIDAGKNLLSWSLNNAAVNLTMGKPTFEQIQTWTRERRGVMSGIPGHAIALRGWAIYNGPGSGDITTGMKFVIYNDPWDGRMHLQSYDTMPITNTRVVGGTPTGRMQESSVGEDPDNDAIMTFDETNRFRTDPNKEDTDDDCIADQFDMHSFLYTTHDSYTPSVADKDNDGLRKHLDPDNDNGGVIDGDEDGNWNGHLDANETNNFDAADDARAPRTCRPPATPEPTPTSVTIPPVTEEPIDEVLIGVVVTILYDDGGHGSFISMPTFIELLINIANGTIAGPFPWVAVSGTVDGEGNISAQGRGTVAGFSNILNTLEGQYSGEGFVGEYTMGAGGGLPGGFPITYYLEGQAVEPDAEPTPPPDIEATSTPVGEGVDFQGFYNVFNRAFEDQDSAVLIDLLHPAVIDLYGVDACQAYLGTVLETLIEVQVVDVSDFSVWNWAIDGLSTPVDDVYTLRLRRSVGITCTKTVRA
jgi:hypothetical protein